MEFQNPLSLKRIVQTAELHLFRNFTGSLTMAALVLGQRVSTGSGECFTAALGRWHVYGMPHKATCAVTSRNGPVFREQSRYAFGNRAQYSSPASLLVTLAGFGDTLSDVRDAMVVKISRLSARLVFGVTPSRTSILNPFSRANSSAVKMQVQPVWKARIDSIVRNLCRLSRSSSIDATTWTRPS
jgi:hypothetical protein